LGVPRSLVEQREQIVAHHQLPVVLFGASGTGKTFTARRIHELSGRPGPFILVNCGRLPRDTTLRPDLVERLLGDPLTMPSLDERREDIALNTLKKKLKQ